MSADPATEAARRRTFAIISHPDAGKTTLTESLLLAGGAIHLAGAVAARGRAWRTTSAWMKIERERGSSGATPVMMFEHVGMGLSRLAAPAGEGVAGASCRTRAAG